jgi:hypothetical protein
MSCAKEFPYSGKWFIYIDYNYFINKLGIRDTGKHKLLHPNHFAPGGENTGRFSFLNFLGWGEAEPTWYVGH